MLPDNIKLLLDKYWKAETTIQEERQIKAYFEEQGGKAVPGDAEMLNEITMPVEVTAPGQEESIFAAIRESQNIKGKQVYFTSQAKVLRRNFFTASMIRKVAAILVMSLTIGILWTKQHIDTENEAAQQAEIQLHMETELMTVSKMLNDGYSGLNQSTQNMVNITKSK